MFKYFLYRIAQFLSRRLSLPASYKLGVFLSDMQYFFSPRDRKAVHNNLRQILQSDHDLPKFTKEVFRNFGRYLVEFFRMEEMVDEQYIRDKVKVHNLEHIQEALKKGKGGILTTAHIGNWEMGGVLLCLLGYPLMIIALPHKERPVNDLFNHQRRVKGLTVVPTQLAIRRCTETLLDNKLIAVAAERDFGAKSEMVDFFGRKIPVPNGPALFSLSTGAPIIPIFLTRREDNSFDLNVFEPIYPDSGPLKDKKQAKLDLMRKYMDVIEGVIRKYPTQWLMFREFGLK